MPILSKRFGERLLNHCEMQMQKTIGPDSRVPQFTVFAEFDASMEAVFNLMGSAEGMQKWVPLCRSVRYTHPDPRTTMGAGSVRHIALAGGAIAIERILKYEPPVRLDYTIESAVIRIDRILKGYVGVTELSARANGRCRLRWEVYFDCLGAAAIFTPVIRAALSWFIGKMVNNICRLTGGTMIREISGAEP
jgi:Polyketide cyclase / dehydrase and lipid transport